MPTDRREFVKTAAAGIVAPLFVPRSAWGANDRIAYGLIGTGNRGGGLNKSFQKIGAQCAALCDVYRPHLASAQKDSPAGVKTYLDYEEVLAQPGLDCIVIATPDHQHMPMLFKALDANKDVYLEKPLSLTPEQSTRMISAVRRTDRVVEIGMQRRSMAFIADAKKMIDEGKIGKVSMVRAMWNWHFALPLDTGPLAGELDWNRFLGTAPSRPLDPLRFRWWRGFWDYSGGNMTDQGTHLMDVVQWLTKSGPPKSAVCQGAITNADGVEVPNVFSAVFEYPAFLAMWTLDYRSTYDFDWSIRFQGEEATMVLSRRGLQLFKDAGLSKAPWTQRVPKEPVLDIPETDSAEAHQQNFLDCIRSRKEPNCPVEIAAAAVAGPHMANIAYRQGRKVSHDEIASPE